ncbi:MAG: hypothetical protein ACOC8J_15480, partial [Ralstonia sp.]
RDGLAGRGRFGRAGGGKIGHVSTFERVGAGVGGFVRRTMRGVPVGRRGDSIFGRDVNVNQSNATATAIPTGAFGCPLGKPLQ